MSKEPAMTVDPVHHVQYHIWATELLLTASGGLDLELLHRDLNASFKSIFGTLVHLYQVDVVWLDRLRGAPPNIPAGVEPEQGIGELELRWPPVRRALLHWVRSQEPEEFSRIVNYRSISRGDYSRSVTQILMHLVNHGTMHRGQIMAMLRQVGVRPPSTDLVLYYDTLNG